MFLRMIPEEEGRDREKKEDTELPHPILEERQIPKKGAEKEGEGREAVLICILMQKRKRGGKKKQALCYFLGREVKGTRKERGRRCGIAKGKENPSFWCGDRL